MFGNANQVEHFFSPKSMCVQAQRTLVTALFKSNVLTQKPKGLGVSRNLSTKFTGWVDVTFGNCP